MTTLNRKFHVTAIGNALVDYLCQVDDAFIEKMNLVKGGFSLIDFDRAQELYNHMDASKKMSGGSAANTIAALAEMGCKTGYIGAIVDDAVGTVFTQEMQKNSVYFQPIIHDTAHNNATGRCYIHVSPDAQRTMSTYLGVAGTVSEEKLDLSLIAQSQIFYVEGYMWVIEDTKKAILKAVDHAHEAGNQTALTLSDVFCVNSFRAEFMDIIRNKFDIIFANEAEAIALFEVNTLEEAIENAKKTGKIFAITCSDKGSIIIKNDTIIQCPAIKPDQLIDTTGAGDAFAAGFLHGLVNNTTLKEAAHTGSVVRIICENY